MTRRAWRIIDWAARVAFFIGACLVGSYIIAAYAAGGN